MPDDRESVKKKLSEVKERILVIARAKNAKKRRQEKRKARCNFEKKKKFKFTKKLFEGEKNGVLRKFGSAPSEKIYRPTLGRHSEPNRPYHPEEKFDNSPLKLVEIKDFVRKAHRGLTEFHISSTKDALKY